LLIKIFGRITTEDYEDEKTNSITIPHYTLLKKLGAKFHRDCARDCYDYRFAQFTIYSCSTPLTSRKFIAIPIPFMKKDFSIGIRHYG